MSLIAATSVSAAAIAGRVGQIPMGFWLRLGAIVAGVILLVVVLRKVAKVNKVLLAAIIFVGCTIVGFNWIYERNEPQWATPVVGKLANFFPSKGKVTAHN